MANKQNQATAHKAAHYEEARRWVEERGGVASPVKGTATVEQWCYV
jgi:hypothetical protein